MDIRRDDALHVFAILDKDGSGDVSYEEFAHQLAQIKNQGLQTQLSFVKHWVYDVKTDVERLIEATCPYERNVLGRPMRQSLSAAGNPSVVERSSSLKARSNSPPPQERSTESASLQSPQADAMTPMLRLSSKHVGRVPRAAESVETIYKNDHAQ